MVRAIENGEKNMAEITKYKEKREKNQLEPNFLGEGY